MKKIMSLLLVGIMMLSLVACGKAGGKRTAERVERRCILLYLQ